MQYLNETVRPEKFDAALWSGFHVNVETFFTTAPRGWRNFFIQSEIKPVLIQTRSHTFSRASRLLRVFSLLRLFSRGIGL